MAYEILNKEKGSEQKEVSPREAVSVDLINVKEFQQREAELSSMGVVEALQEVKIKSQLSGKVEQVKVEMGDKIEKGELMVELDHAELDSQLDQNKASIEKMRREIEKIEAGASSEQIRQARISVEQAEASLEQARTQLEQTKVNNEAMIENARIGVRMASSTLNNRTSSSRQQLSDAYDNLKLASANLLSTVRSALTAGGNILGMQPGDKSANDYYEHLLGAKNSQSLRDAEREFKQARRSYNEARKYHEELASEVSIEEGEELDDLAGKSLEETNSALNDIRTVLENTVTGQALPSNALGELKQQIDSQISYIDQAQQSLQTQRQAVANAELSSESTEDEIRLNYQQALQELENAEQKAQSNLKSARSAMQTQKKGVEKARASYDEVTSDAREVDLAPLRSSIDELLAAQQGIQEKIQKAYIRAPFAGEAGSVPVKEDELVKSGDVVVSLVNKSGLQVRSYIGPKDKKYIQTGAPASISEEDVSGTVSHISPEVDEKTKKVEIITKVNGKNTDLVNGEYAEVRIDISPQMQKEGVYFLPFRAVQVRPDAAYVFIVNEDNKAERREVELGRVVNKYNEIKQGLSPDMRIVEDVRGLEEGEKIEIGK